MSPDSTQPLIDFLPSHLVGLAPTMPVSLDGLTTADTAWPVLRAPRSAAVVMLFIPGSTPTSPAEVVLTRRSTSVRSHKGQIGFAGGRTEADDVSPARTALRELEEELGVPSRHVDVIGQLPALSSLDGAPIIPVVAYASIAIEEMLPAADEVESVFTTPWPELAAEQDRPFRFNVFGRWRTSHFFALSGPPPRAVWGLTAQIIAGARLRQRLADQRSEFDP